MNTFWRWYVQSYAGRLAAVLCRVHHDDYQADNQEDRGGKHLQWFLHGEGA